VRDGYGLEAYLDNETDTWRAQLFHLANQAESRDNKEIAALTARIAQQTQRDSASMITIAAVTMFFLPGTFVAVRCLTGSSILT
jgi:hypothetical protein